MKKMNERGETLVEVVMALGILSLVLVSSYALATGTFRLGRGAGERTQAVNYLQQQAEALRTYRDSVDWNNEFVPTMSIYLGKEHGFCMKQTNNVWKPTDIDCTIDGFKIAIVPTPVVTDPLNQQYNFALTGDWKTGAQDNNVSLTTKLVNQDL